MVDNMNWPCINGEPRSSILATKSFNALSSCDQSKVKIKTASWLVVQV